ncbi:hypothetical protein [Vibrio sp. R78045]|uniref:hypothetical protein n=1 Tax=Vibrio sp. R78045 TaxID=3093868 RepID=UPI0036F2ACE3
MGDKKVNEFIYLNFKGFSEYLPLIANVNLLIKKKMLASGYASEDVRKFLDDHFSSSRYRLNLVNSDIGSARYNLEGEKTSEVIMLWQKMPYVANLSELEVNLLNPNGRVAMSVYQKTEQERSNTRIIKAKALLSRGYSPDTITNLAGSKAFEYALNQESHAPSEPCTQVMEAAFDNRPNFLGLDSAAQKKFIDQLVSVTDVRLLQQVTGRNENQLGSILLDKLALQ